MVFSLLEFCLHDFTIIDVLSSPELENMSSKGYHYPVMWLQKSRVKGLSRTLHTWGGGGGPVC